MADILIRGMDMPKYTTKAEFGIDADGNPLCMVYHEDGTEPDIYDVVSLPKGHGRLGDLDKLEDAFIRYYLSQERNNHLVFTPVEIKQHFADMIGDWPAIVPADVPDIDVGNKMEGGGEE